MKAVLFATGPLYHAAREARTIADRLGAANVRVVASAEEAPALRNQVEGIRVDAAGLMTLLRLWLFAPGEVYCLSYGHSHRGLKLFAYAVRGRVVFIGSIGQAHLGFIAFLMVRMQLMIGRGDAALLVGSAKHETLERLAVDLQERRKASRVDVLENPSLADFARAVRNWRDYQCVAIPWTAEGHNFLKMVAWLLPCGPREIYNEVGNSFAARRVGMLFAHIGRRISERVLRLWSGVRYATWRTGDALATAWNGVRYAIWWVSDRTLAAYYAMVALPGGVSVMGSASGYYMRGIVEDLRRKHPGEPIYGMLPAHLIRPVGPMFDHVIPLTTGNVLRHVFGRTRTGYLAIPCTNEGYNRLKLLAVLLPLGRRLIYNENADGYPVRRWSTVVEHGFWRLRHRLFYQAFTERRGRSWLTLGMHLVLYPLRLVAGAFVIAGIRLRAHRRPPAPAPVVKVLAAKTQTTPRVLDPAEP